MLIWYFMYENKIHTQDSFFLCNQYCLKKMKWAATPPSTPWSGGKDWAKRICHFIYWLQLCLPCWDCLSIMAQMPVLCWIWMILPQEQLPRTVLTNALSWCFFLLSLSRKYYTIHKKARTSEKKCVKASHCQVLFSPTSNNCRSWQLETPNEIIFSTACTDIDLQVQFRCLSIHNALR